MACFWKLFMLLVLCPYFKVFQNYSAYSAIGIDFHRDQIKADSESPSAFILRKNIRSCLSPLKPKDPVEQLHNTITKARASEKLLIFLITFYLGVLIYQKDIFYIFLSAVFPLGCASNSFYYTAHCKNTYHRALSGFLDLLILRQ